MAKTVACGIEKRGRNSIATEKAEQLIVIIGRSDFIGKQPCLQFTNPPYFVSSFFNIPIRSIQLEISL
jgi:hypothetical protein